VPEATPLFREGIISPKRLRVPVELRFRQFLGEQQRVGSSLISILVRLDNWTASIVQRSDVGAPLGGDSSADIIEQIAKGLSSGTSGTEQQIIVKSLQEAVFTCVGFDTNLDAARVGTRLKRYFDRHGKTAFIRKFLSHYFFNFVWSQIGESFRAESDTNHSFELAMRTVDEICQKTVASVLASAEFRNRHLDHSLAEKLIQNIEERLHGN
jgi:hypothetical protein